MSFCLSTKLALVGLRGAGKTSVGRELSARLGLPFVDLDERIAAAAGFGHVGELIAAHGLPAFRELERDELAAVLAEPRRLIVSTGGGAVEDPRSRRLLRTEALTVWLRAPLEILRERVARDERGRAAGAVPLRPAIVPPPGAGSDDAGPEALDHDEFTVLQERRAPLYREVSRRAIDVEFGSPLEIARRIERIWRG
ncbi:Shikimate kinase 2 [Planctomycetes bacterium Poly30]|uniref:Shikimate kinase n=1 Tax=Saltatorellus ferox TaxID=2528018 RepID=A0A518EWV1_9BACT|nr:Shikimate kinase 2 [Planctomycetes bacterium Poly30]